MRRTSFSPMACSLARALDRIGDWWSPLILRDLFLGISRFDDLVENLGISRNALTSRLSGLCETGLIEKAGQGRRAGYQLTQAGHDLVPVLVALAAWGDRWSAPFGPPMLFSHDCGSYQGPKVVCGACAQDMTSDSIHVHPGPGGRSGPGTQVIAQRFAAQQKAPNRKSVQGQMVQGQMPALPD